MNFRLLLVLALLFACQPLRAAEDGTNTDPSAATPTPKPKTHQAATDGTSTDSSKATPKPKAHQDGWIKGLAKKVWPFGKKPGDPTSTPPKGSVAGKAWHDLTPTLVIEPAPLKLSEVRTIKVTLDLRNTGRKMVQLDFPTSQRIEVLLKDSTGKMVEQWSEDQAFQSEPSTVAINPQEHLEYVANVATRELKAGQAYTVEAFFPTYDQIRASKPITPLP